MDKTISLLLVDNSRNLAELAHHFASLLLDVGIGSL